MKTLCAFAFACALGTVGVLVSQSQSPTTPPKPPKKVVEEYFKMGAQGKLLTPVGWQEADKFFVRPSPFSEQKQITIINKEYVVWEREIRGARADVVVDFLPQGEIDPLLRFKPSKYMKAGVGYYLVLTEKHWESGLPEGPQKEVTGPAEWRIEASPPGVWLTEDAAIQYVTEARGKSSDPAIRRNADETIAILKSIH